MKVGAKLASYICQAIILIVAAELKTITAAKRKEMFLKILPSKQKILTLMKNADLAMYRAKDAGKNTYRFFSEEMDLIATEHVELENELSRALENDQFTLMYQPKMCLNDQKVIGLEALIRWIHPTKGFIPPVNINLFALSAL